MKKTLLVTTGILLAALAPSSPGADPAQPRQGQRPSQPRQPGAMNPAAITQAIAQWPEQPKLGAQLMLSQYGAPQEVTSEKLVWLDQGPYKRITVTKMAHHHDFPLPHLDFLEHTVSFQVPEDKTAEISKFDGSATYDRTRGELSGRCDLEGHNILTLNIAHDIATGKKSAEDARKAFSEIVVEDMLGKNPAYVTALQFKPAEATAATFADTPTIPGAPVRPDSLAKDAKKPKGDAGEGEVLGFVTAVNINEIVGAMVASKKKVSSQVAQYAKMLHEQHGQNLDQTLKLGDKIGTTPLITPAVAALQNKAAGELATIVPLDGEQFGNAYITAMVKGHTEVLNMIDSQLLPKARNEELKKHLTMTRQHVAHHLEAAQSLQSGAGVGAPSRTPATGVGQSQRPQVPPQNRQN